MDKYVKFCSVCNKTKQNMEWCDDEKTIEFSKGYWNVCVPKDGLVICPACNKGVLTDSVLTHEEFNIIEDVSNQNRQFLEAMIKLKQDDPIEYQLKLNQFKLQQEQHESIREQEREINLPHCPTCGSTNIKKITGTERAMSVVGLGIFSKKINKSYKCLNCKCTW